MFHQKYNLNQKVVKSVPQGPSSSFRISGSGVPIRPSSVMVTSVAAGSGFAVPDLRPGIAGFALVCTLMLSACLATIPLAFSAMRSRILMPGLGRS